MKKAVFVMVFVFMIIGSVCAQVMKDMSYEHFYESMEFVAGNNSPIGEIQGGMISSVLVFDPEEAKEMEEYDTDNDGYFIAISVMQQFTWGFVMNHIRSGQHVLIAISSDPNYISNIDQSTGAKVYNFNGTGQRTAFLTAISAAKQKFDAIR